MASEVKAPHERIEAAVQRIRDVAGKATPGPWCSWETEIYSGGFLPLACVSETLNVEDAAFIALFDPTLAELVARLLEGEAARWATRPVADWEIYNSTPLAALVRHIVGEETKA